MTASPPIAAPLRTSAAATPIRASVSLESPLAVASDDAPAATVSVPPDEVELPPPFSPVATSTGLADSLSRVTDAGESLPGGPIQPAVSQSASV